MFALFSSVISVNITSGVVLSYFVRLDYVLHCPILHVMSRDGTLYCVLSYHVTLL